MRYQSIRALLIASGLVIVLTTFAFAQSNSIFLPIVSNQSQQPAATPSSDIPPDAVEDTLLERADSAVLASLTGQFTQSVGQTTGVKCSDGSRLRLLRVNGSNGYPDMT